MPPESVSKTQSRFRKRTLHSAVVESLSSGERRFCLYRIPARCDHCHPINEAANTLNCLRCILLFIHITSRLLFWSSNHSEPLNSQDNSAMHPLPLEMHPSPWLNAPLPKVICTPPYVKMHPGKQGGVQWYYNKQFMPFRVEITDSSYLHSLSFCPLTALINGIFNGLRRNIFSILHKPLYLSKGHEKVGCPNEN